MLFHEAEKAGRTFRPCRGSALGKMAATARGARKRSFSNG
jgi:hypothetical protein